eukprot:m.163897 g.163897  ORF g.163897 m.163897 type:complete len:55 (-) comp16564_c0_seq1:3110-3274(-)
MRVAIHQLRVYLLHLRVYLSFGAFAYMLRPFDQFEYIYYMAWCTPLQAEDSKLK